MTSEKDRLTIFPEEKSGEAGKAPNDGALDRSLKRPGETQVTPLGDDGQERAKEFRRDLDRQTLGGKMGEKPE